LYQRALAGKTRVSVRLAARSGGRQGAVFEITLPAGNLGQLMESA
jgi:hypothetical protein